MTEATVPPAFELYESVEPCRLVVRGDIDIASEKPFLDTASGCLRAGRTSMVVDLTAVTFMDSSGLRALLQFQQDAAEWNCGIVLSVAPGPVTLLLTMAGVSDRFRYE